MVEPLLSSHAAPEKLTIPRSVLGILAAMLMVSSLMTSPITQQAIQFPTRLDPVNGTAFAPQVVNMRRDDKSGECLDTCLSRAFPRGWHS